MTLLIANDGPLPPEWLDHPLTGDWSGHRECHIGGDFLLIYTLDDSGKSGLVVFVRSGTHSGAVLVARKSCSSAAAIVALCGLGPVLGRSHRYAHVQGVCAATVDHPAQR